MEIDDQKKKSVNNYQQLATIIFGWSSIINNYQQFARGDVVNNYRQLPTIIFWGGQQLSTIGNNYFLFEVND